MQFLIVIAILEFKYDFTVLTIPKFCFIPKIVYSIAYDDSLTSYPGVKITKNINLKFKKYRYNKLYWVSGH